MALGSSNIKARIPDAEDATGVLFHVSHSEIAIQQLEALESFIISSATPITCNGSALNLASIAAVARYDSKVHVDSEVSRLMLAGFEALQTKLTDGEVIYGVNTLFGGSADLRTKQTIQLQQTLIRELHYGILPEMATKRKSAQVIEKFRFDLSLESPPELSYMPYTWARAAVLIRLNSLVKGFSGVRPVVAQRLKDLLDYNIIPVIPLRGSISASGDLSPLSYIAGTLQGKRTIRVFSDKGQIITADHAFAQANLEPIILQPKEGLAIVNGTAVSCAVAALTLYDVHGLAVLSQVVTAMSVEALRGTVESFDSVFAEARPHPGQTDSAHNIRNFLVGSKLTIANDGAGSSLRQDRYSLRTAPQWIGPVLEDIILAHQQITIELNSATDNPLVTPHGTFLHGGNFQAKAVTSAMEKTRQGLHSIGRLVYVQCTEMINPATNQGLPANLVAEDPSTSFIFKGTDIYTAALLSELGFLATPVDHVQSAEMGNQSLNSLALISARYTHLALEVLSQLLATALVAICQALDLRALQLGFLESYRPEFGQILRSGLVVSQEDDLKFLEDRGWRALLKNFDATASMDISERFQTVAKAVREVVLDYEDEAKIFSTINQLNHVVNHLAESLHLRWSSYRDAYLMSESAGDASPFLGFASRRIYRYIRNDLGVPLLHTKKLQTPGTEVPLADPNDSEEAPTVGHFTSLVYRAVRDGRLVKIALELLRDSQEINTDGK